MRKFYTQYFLYFITKFVFVLFTSSFGQFYSFIILASVLLLIFKCLAFVYDFNMHNRYPRSSNCPARGFIKFKLNKERKFCTFSFHHELQISSFWIYFINFQTMNMQHNFFCNNICFQNKIKKIIYLVYTLLYVTFSIQFFQNFLYVTHIRFKIRYVQNKRRRYQRVHDDESIMRVIAIPRLGFISDLPSTCEQRTKSFYIYRYHSYDSLYIYL